jgi:pilus assembly protein CpaE
MAFGMTQIRVIAVGGPPTFRPQIARALKTEPEAIDWVPSAAAAESATDQAANLYQLMVLSPLIDEAEAAAIARSLASRSPATAIVVVHDRPFDGAMPRLIRAGVRDVVDLSRGAAELEEALAQAIAWSENVRLFGGPEGAAPRGHVVSIFSTKGGTGKTFLATNLGAAIAATSGKDTAILDLDVDLGDVFAYFGVEPTRSLADLAMQVGQASKEETAHLGTRLGKHIVGFGSPPDPGASPLTGEAMGEVVRALRSAFPYTVIDATCDYADHVLAALELSDDILLVTGLDVISVRHLSLGMRTLENLGIPRERMRVVLNRADSKVELTGKDIEEALGITVDARIPSSALVPRSINICRLLWYAEPNSPVVKSLGRLAAKILAPPAAATPPARPDTVARAQRHRRSRAKATARRGGAA